jgi:arginase
MVGDAMSGPSVTIDLEKIEKNAREITTLCARHGIEVTGVTKATCGMPPVASAMLRGGVVGIGESRMENIRRLRSSGILSTARKTPALTESLYARDLKQRGFRHAPVPIMLLRIPPLSAVDEIVTTVDISLNSELSTIEGLSDAARRAGLVHDIILMVDVGDLREGIWPDDLIPTVREVVKLPGVRIIGIGTNLSCYGGVIPTRHNMNILIEYAREIEKTFTIDLMYISGGNSSALTLISEGGMPGRVNHMRIGEAILLGRETIKRMPWPGTSQDAFLLEAEVIELKEKPAVPIGERSQDAFGRTPTFAGEECSRLTRLFKRFFPPKGKQGEHPRRDMIRAILNIGREDVDVEGIAPVDTRLSILGASSDHLLVDVTKAEKAVELGTALRFSLNYSALLLAMTSAYVEKVPILGPNEEGGNRGVVIIGVPGSLGSRISGTEKTPAALREAGIVEKIAAIGIPVEDWGDVTPPRSADTDTEDDRFKKVVDLSDRVADMVSDAVRKRFVPLILGGDDSISLGLFKGLSEALGGAGSFGLLWFDAHGDFSIDQTGGDKDFSRMILAQALGYAGYRGGGAEEHGKVVSGSNASKNKRDEEQAEGQQAERGMSHRETFISPENVVIIGLREVEPAEAKRISESGIVVFTMEDIDASGMKEVMYRALRAASMGTRGIYLSLDMDVVDAVSAPGTMHPTKGGLTYREMHLAMELLAKSGLLLAADVVGIDPHQDPDGITANEAVAFLLSAFGKKILGR